MSNIFTKTEKIRFQHIDYAGIVFYPRYLEMLNTLVEDFFEEALDLPFNKMHETGGIPTVDLKIQFKKPARLGEILTKYFWIKTIGKSSLLCGFRFENADKEICLEGEVTLVSVSFSEDRNSIKAQAFSEKIKEKIEKYLIN
jgi:4-hydroxybenzoyl-CoA thioesterase